MKLFRVLFIFLCLCNSINAQIISIPADQPTIQAGIDIASNGDTVIVDPGNYVENINFNGKNIVLGSLFLTTNDTSYISQTIIDGNQNGSVVIFENNEDSLSVLSGFTITNGSGNPLLISGSYGGGILCDNASPKLQHLHITGNSAGGGGGICTYDSSAIIEKVNVTNNSVTTSAGGIYFKNSYNTDLENSPKPRLLNSSVTNNSSGSRAGGIYCEYAIVTLAKIKVTNNTASNGGGFYVGNAMLIMTSSTVSDNIASEGGVMYLDGSESILINSILWNNSPQNIYLYPDPGFSTVTMAFSNVQGGQSIINSYDGVVNWENGNIDSDPLFTNDYHLQSNSPCIDSGTSFFEWQTDTIVNLMPDEYSGSAPDMGVHENNVISNVEMVENPQSNLQVYPNPSKDEITIDYYLEHSSKVDISIYNSVGHHIKTLISTYQGKGNHQIIEALNNTPSGTYFIVKQTDNNVSTSLLIKQ